MIVHPYDRHLVVKVNVVNGALFAVADDQSELYGNVLDPGMKPVRHHKSVDQLRLSETFRNINQLLLLQNSEHVVSAMTIQTRKRSISAHISSQK